MERAFVQKDEPRSETWTVFEVLNYLERERADILRLKREQLAFARHHRLLEILPNAAYFESLRDAFPELS